MDNVKCLDKNKHEKIYKISNNIEKTVDIIHGIMYNILVKRLRETESRFTKGKQKEVKRNERKTGGKRHDKRAA